MDKPDSHKISVKEFNEACKELEEEAKKKPEICQLCGAWYVDNGPSCKCVSVLFSEKDFINDQT